jgi:hypothetical protein
MLFHTLIVDNFYDDPDAIREYALKQKFYKRIGDYPGVRSDRISDLNRPLFELFVNRLIRICFNVAPKKIEYDIITNFQLIDGKYNKGWIHQDDINYFDVAGVVYLSPDAPIDAGTSIYKPIVNAISKISQPMDPHIIQNLNIHDYNKIQEAYNSQFKKTIEVGNVYNRLVVYPAVEWHTQSGFFGSDNESSRLTQVFFARFTLC